MVEIIKNDLSAIRPIDLLIYTLIILIIFLILREITCWYYKINEITKLLKSIDSKLSIQADNYIFDKEITHNTCQEKVNNNIESINKSVTKFDEDATNNKYGNNIEKRSLKEILTHKYSLRDIIKYRNRK